MRSPPNARCQAAAVHVDIGIPCPPIHPTKLHRNTLHTTSKSPLGCSPNYPLQVAALRATPGRLLEDLEFLGFLFEPMVIRDLHTFARATDAEVFHYREKEGFEVDAVVEAARGLNPTPAGVPATRTS